jgi:hypothetical protein
VVSVAHLTATQQSRGLMARQTETRSAPGRQKNVKKMQKIQKQKCRAGHNFRCPCYIGQRLKLVFPCTNVNVTEELLHFYLEH